MTTALKEPLAKPAITAKPAAPITIGADMHVGISSFGAWMLGVGSIIGSMAWLIHGPMMARSGPVGAAVAFVVAGVMMLPLVLILMELSSMFPTAGGPYVYKYYALKRLMPKTGELFGFLTGWLFWACMIVGLACMANGLTNLLSSSLWGSAKNSPMWFGPFVIFSLFGFSTVLNLLHIKNAAFLSSIFGVMKLTMALAFGAVVLFSPHASVANIFATTGSASGTGLLGSVASVLMLGLAGFGGVEMATCSSSETSNARASVPRSVLLTLITVTAIYASMSLAVGAAAPYVISPDKTTMIIAGTQVQATCPDLIGYLAGPTARIVFASCVVASIVGCGFTCLLGIARVAYSMSSTGLFPAQFGQLDEKTRVPKYALWFQMWCLIIVGVGANMMARTGFFPDAYTFLAETFGFLYAFLALMYGVCAVSLRYTDPHIARPFRIGKNGNALIWALSLVTVSIWGYAAFGSVHWSHQLAGASLLLAGMPIYAWYRWRQS